MNGAFLQRAKDRRRFLESCVYSRKLLSQSLLKEAKCAQV